MAQKTGSKHTRSTRFAVTAAAVLLGTAAAVPGPARAATAAAPVPLSAAASAASWSAVSSSDESPSAPSGARHHCVITLHGLAAPSARCGAAAETRAGRAGTLLMTWYKDAGFRGDSADVRDSAGTCDQEGYGIPDIEGFLGRGWDDSVSSFRTFGRCAVVQGFEGSVYGGASRTWIGDRSFVGTEWNDRISSFLMHA